MANSLKSVAVIMRLESYARRPIAESGATALRLARAEGARAATRLARGARTAHARARRSSARAAVVAARSAVAAERYARDASRAAAAHGDGEGVVVSLLRLITAAATPPRATASLTVDAASWSARDEAAQGTPLGEARGAWRLVFAEARPDWPLPLGAWALRPVPRVRAATAPPSSYLYTSWPRVVTSSREALESRLGRAARARCRRARAAGAVLACTAAIRNARVCVHRMRCALAALNARRALARRMEAAAMRRADNLRA